jgi:hypothetical protein
MGKIGKDRDLPAVTQPPELTDDQKRFVGSATYRELMLESIAMHVRYSLHPESGYTRTDSSMAATAKQILISLNAHKTKRSGVEVPVAYVLYSVRKEVEEREKRFRPAPSACATDAEDAS